MGPLSVREAPVGTVCVVEDVGLVGAAQPGSRWSLTRDMASGATWAGQGRGGWTVLGAPRVGVLSSSPPYRGCRVCPWAFWVSLGEGGCRGGGWDQGFAGPPRCLRQSLR